MEHEVFVPVAAERLRVALADPAQVARALPGLQQDAGSEPVAGRLKLRVGGHTITYRGAVRVSARDDDTYAVEAEGTEVRGHGTVKLTLTLRLAEAEDGSTLTFTGTASADGRITEQSADAVDSAVTRLLSRFAENLGAGQDPGPEPEADGTAQAEQETAQAAGSEAVEGQAGEDFEPAATGDVEAAPDAEDAAVPEPTEAEPADDLEEVGEPPAEAAHARRTMIGRSAEEVDHAPPRGRYAPVPAPQTVSPSPVLRWAVPAAAFAVASAIVVGRALRKRR
ncbi:SRPBCC family protein [Streptomyces sp. NPDC048751]|uniref:SRPBCC family protein n=1 Tax=Streptomyces sp. NPDC048751 TaxID=3365591 RepID=UPI00371B9F87